MKPYALLIALFFSGLAMTMAQERTRDKLFPHFKEDVARMQEKNKDVKTTAAPQARATRSTKEQLFTDYRPQNTTTRTGKALKTNRVTGKNPSEVSSTEATKNIRANQPALPAPIAVPTQGAASENINVPVKSSALSGSPASIKQTKPVNTAPVNTAPVVKPRSVKQ
ncbi:hypothetical protein [Chitinophaga agri]|uniref:Uncharacterized protein n=1 Tax=Chitinophaga agri TaxID=2703787 RepID=A0A6B9ZMQ3_9BACT|nr:hypothetical protein [Chitinophaga agri]QHS62435.1 hypothetical protein GWR21_23455 [Chitinophaga agri]